MKMGLGKRKLLLLGLIPVTLSGCASYPIAKNIRQQAKPLTLLQVAANPGACRGTVVIWGGRIIKTVNDVNGGALYVLKLPLNSRGKPMVNANSSGRFIASSKGFLDPEVYKQGRLVTAAGVVAGLEVEPIQKTKYTYPVVAIRQIHIWPVVRRYYYYPAWNWGYYPYGPAWDWGWYPGWSVGWSWYYGGDWDRDYHYHDRRWKGNYWHYHH